MIQRIQGIPIFRQTYETNIGMDGVIFKNLWDSSNQFWSIGSICFVIPDISPPFRSIDFSCTVSWTQNCQQLHKIRHTQPTINHLIHQVFGWVLDVVGVELGAKFVSSHHPMSRKISPKKIAPFSGLVPMFGRPSGDLAVRQVQFVPAKLRSTYNGAAPRRDEAGVDGEEVSADGVRNKGASTEPHVCFWTVFFGCMLWV